MKRTTILVALICFLLSSFPSIGFTQTQHNETDQPALSSESLEEWIRLLQSEDDAQRILAAQQLHRMEKPNLRALPYLTKALFDKERKVVILSAQTIGSLGKEAKPALPMLVKKLTSDDDYLVLAIGVAIGAIGENPNSL